MATSMKLWDPLVRIFHASLIVAFFGNYFFTEEGETVHEWLGYYAAAFVLVRLFWGLRAAGAASWRDCWPTPARLRAHAGALLRGRPFHRLGHSPIGALVMLTMMAIMASLAVTGFMMEEIDYFWGEEWLEEFHELLANGLMGLACLHVAAAIFESVQLRENLPLSMITGRRRPLP